MGTDRENNARRARRTHTYMVATWLCAWPMDDDALPNHIRTIGLGIYNARPYKGAR